MRMRRGEGARPLKHFLVPAAAARPKRGGRLAGRGEREEGGGGGGWCLGVCVFERGERKSVSGLVYKGQGGDLVARYWYWLLMRSRSPQPLPNTGTSTAHLV